MSSVVFKQSYKARDAPGVAGLNVRHLQYITTRPGTVYNPGCGFGLWGKLPGQEAVAVQTDLEAAKDVVRTASQGHTLYRAIISVGKEDAEELGLYDRQKWEELVNRNIAVIAREMDIRSEDFCWCASMHRKAGHPHVHLLYWDNSDNPRPEGIPRHKFEGKAERIRAAFSGDLHREEIREIQKEQRSQTAALRQLLHAMCRETNPAKTLEATRLSEAQLADLSQKMEKLLSRLPTRGSLNYGYLPPECKALVDELVDRCLSQPELAAEVARYKAMVDKVSDLYANGDKGKAANWEKAYQRLRRDMANEVMKAVRQLRRENGHTGDHTGEDDRQRLPPEVRQQLRQMAREICGSMDEYRALLELLPEERIPWSKMAEQIPGWNDQLDKVVAEVMSDARMRQFVQEQGGDSADASREVERELRRQLTAMVRQDAGWDAEAARTGTVNMMCSMMGLLSQLVGQEGSRRDSNARKLYSRDKSREAQKDSRAAAAQGSDWSDDF